jgi:hypothetical protein
MRGRDDYSGWATPDSGVVLLCMDRINVDPFPSQAGIQIQQVPHG